MKKIIYSMIPVLVVSFFLTSCLKEDNVKNPTVSSAEMYMTAKDGKDSLITDIFSGKKIKIVIYSDADMVSIWPGGIRTIMKMKNRTVDSIDMFNHPVLIKSDCYSDYGLVKAQGLATTLQSYGGWYASYTYPTAGEFDLTIVVTNHGYDGPDLKRIIYEPGKVTIK